VNVLHVDEQRGWRGGEQQASWLMQGQVQAGHRVHIAARPGSAFLTSDHGGAGSQIARIALPLRGEWDLASAYRLGRYVVREGIDILHAHTSHAHTLAVLGRRFAGRGKVVVSRRVSFAPKTDPFNRWKYAQPDLLISVSHRVDQVLAEAGIPAARRAVVHSAVDLQRLDAPAIPRATLGVPEGVPLLVTAGALVGHKDIENLIAALAIVRRTLPSVHLVIAGEGERRAAIEARIATLGLQDAVRLLGHRKDAPQVIQAGDCYVSSSWSEGLGTSILEALACGVPVVACEAGGAAEMVLPGETGYLVPARDAEALAAAIVASLSDRDAAQAMAVRGRQHIQDHFLVERMVAGTLAAYAQLG
jgi:glycosyltransferase involved in cell wall biosynthesis